MLYVPKIKNYETALKVYYSNLEIGNKEIKQLFGNKISTDTMSKLKNAVRAEMNNQGKKCYYAHSVNTKTAFEVWGIDIILVEQHYNKLKKLGLNSNEC